MFQKYKYQKFNFKNACNVQTNQEWSQSWYSFETVEYKFCSTQHKTPLLQVQNKNCQLWLTLLFNYMWSSISLVFKCKPEHYSKQTSYSVVKEKA